MLTREQLLTLFEYSLWADERLLDACASLTPGTWARAVRTAPTQCPQDIPVTISSMVFMGGCTHGF